MFDILNIVKTLQIFQIRMGIVKKTTPYDYRTNSVCMMKIIKSQITLPRMLWATPILKL